MTSGGDGGGGSEAGVASGGDGDLCTVTAAIGSLGNFAIGVAPRASLAMTPGVASVGNGAEGVNGSANRIKGSVNGSANRIEGSVHCADGTDDEVSAAVSCGAPSGAPHSSAAA